MKRSTGGAFLIYLPELILFLACVLLYAGKLHADLWNDEIYSLKFFSLVPMQTSMTDYHVPNNHIFYNLLNNIYLKMSGQDSLDILLDNAWRIRLLPYIFHLISCFFLYLILRRKSARWFAWMAVIILISSIPWYQHALLVRGYGLSSMLLLMLLYFLLSTHFKIKECLISALIACLLLYTLPSNLYFLLAIIILYLCQYLYELFRNSAGKFFRNYNIIRITSLLSALVLAILLYLPVLKEMLFNPYVERAGLFHLDNLIYYAKDYFRGIISGRWGLILLLLPGLFFLFKRRCQQSQLALLTASIALLPLIFVFIRGGNPPSRIFIPAFPAVALLITLGTEALLNNVFPRKELQYFGIALIIFYCGFNFWLEDAESSAKISQDLKEGIRTQNLYHQYYSYHYQPGQEAEFISNQYHKEKLVLLIYGCEPYGIHVFLERHDIPFISEFKQPGALDSLLSKEKSLYIISNNVSQFQGDSNINMKLVSTSITYHNLMRIEVNKD